MPVENDFAHHMRLISIVGADICTALGVTFPMINPAQSFGRRLASEHVHSHASETQGKAKALWYCMPVISKHAK
jgi:glycerol uptake facilitator-like aquaporin